MTGPGSAVRKERVCEKLGAGLVAAVLQEVRSIPA
jgi:hypothetical protein